MIGWFIKRFVRDADNVKNRVVREQYSVLSGSLGLCCNLLLFLVKLAIGAWMNSIAIISDAFNNLSDMGSSLISIIGAKMSNKRPDKEHPFGHGRIEYISALIVSFLIMMVGIELGKSSIDKILHPEPLAFSWVLMGILMLSILVKVWMFSYNRYMGKKIQSPVLEATAKDSINDVISTSAVIVSTILGQLIHLPIDGIIGTLVSVLILYGGFSIAKDTVGMLLGTSPSKELVQEIRDLVLARPEIIGIHDLIVHDYGPGRVMASLHAEVSDDSDILLIHEVIDDTEQQIQQELGIEVVIHMDPIAQNCEEVNRLREEVLAVIHQLDNRFSIHDFRIVQGENRINLIFDMVVPFGMPQEESDRAVLIIIERIMALDPRYHTVIQIDHGYCEE